MFGLFKRKKDISNRVFGTVKLFGRRWSTSVKADITLWDKVYELNCNVVADKECPEINQTQENVFSRFVEKSCQFSGQVEKIVADYFGTTDASVLLSKFCPYELMISPNGECAIIASNADDEDVHDVLPGLAVIVYPKMAIFTEEEYSEYVLRGGEYKIKAALYEEE